MMIDGLRLLLYKDKGRFTKIIYKTITKGTRYITKSFVLIYGLVHKDEFIHFFFVPFGFFNVEVKDLSFSFINLDQLPNLQLKDVGNLPAHSMTLCHFYQILITDIYPSLALPIQ